MNRLTVFALLATAISFAPVSSPAFAAGGNAPDCNDPALKNTPVCMTMQKHKGTLPGTGTPGPGAPGPGAPGASNQNTNGQNTNGQNTFNGNKFGNGNKSIVCPGGQKPLPGGNCPPPLRGPSNGNGPPNGNGPSGNGPPNGNGMNNGGPSLGANGFFNFNQHQHDDFRQRFRSFNFGFFPLPNFSVTLGSPVPRHYGLRPVPYGIYSYYPQFRGYLFFVTRNGNVVIVSPRTYRIVAVL